MALVLRSVNRVNWEQLWRVICSSIWGETWRPSALPAHSAHTLSALSMQLEPDAVLQQ